MNKIPFTQKEKNTIAEYIHALGTDTLIINEVSDLIETLSTHGLIIEKEGYLRRLKEKDPALTADIDLILKTKISDEQGTSIMDEYYGRKTPKKDPESKEKEPEQQQNYRWGVGKNANEKPYDTVKIGGSEFELIHGEFPHSRRDNTTYARSKDNPKRIYGFDGHRLPFKIEIEESNYLKSSEMSGDEIRKSCTGKLSLNGVVIFEGGGRTYDRAFKNIQNFIDSMEEKWSWYPFKLDEWKGKIIKYEGQLFRIQSFIVSQGCMILVTPDGKPRLPFAYEQEEVEEGNFDGVETLKVEVNSDKIWWYPTKKEIAPFVNGGKK